MTSQKNPTLYTRYPWSSIVIYNGATIAHYVLGGLGIILGYSSWIGYLLGSFYLAFSFVEMYLHMPIKVCRNCVYYRLDNSRCISGLNLVSRRIAEEGQVAAFPSRAGGLLCPNNLYIASLAFPIPQNSLPSLPCTTCLPASQVHGLWQMTASLSTPVASHSVKCWHPVNLAVAQTSAKAPYAVNRRFLGSFVSKYNVHMNTECQGNNGLPSTTGQFGELLLGHFITSKASRSSHSLLPV
jgi:hypothetical protein